MPCVRGTQGPGKGRRRTEDRIYLQVARRLENDIISGILREGDQVPSTHQVSERQDVNPATAARGVSLLTAAGLLDKKRGIGLFVARGAREAILERRREAFRGEMLTVLLAEARLLGISRRDIVAMIMAEKYTAPPLK